MYKYCIGHCDYYNNFIFKNIYSFQFALKPYHQKLNEHNKQRNKIIK